MRVAMLLLIALPAQAHDFWIEVEGADVDLYVGPEAYPVERFPRSLLHARRFDRIDPDGAIHPVPGEEGAIPAGVFDGGPGTHTLCYRSVGNPLVLAPEKFRDYLREEGQQHALATHPVDQAGRERFYRSAKAIVGQGQDWLCASPIELVPLTDRTPGPVTFLLLFDGRPLPDTRVAAYRYAGAPAAEGRTDAAGQITLPLNQPGRWLIKAVHLIPSPRQIREDWHSHWASLTLWIGDQ